MRGYVVPGRPVALNGPKGQSSVPEWMRRELNPPLCLQFQRPSRRPASLLRMLDYEYLSQRLNLHNDFRRFHLNVCFRSGRFTNQPENKQSSELVIGIRERRQIPDWIFNPDTRC